MRTASGEGRWGAPPLTPRGRARPLGLSLPCSPPRAFLGAVLAPGLCQVLVVVTKEVEEKNSWLLTD